MAVHQKLEILYEDADILAVHKPAGLLVHAAASSPGEETLADLFPDCEIVHRLDRDTSGVLVLAKNASAAEMLKSQFKNRLAHKTYLALVYGKVAKDEDTIRFAIARGKTGRMAARPQNAEGREAITHFSVLKRFRTTTLLELTIETGRTHQIRAHLFGYGYPVVGDPLYARRLRKIRPLELTRPFLHASELRITLPSGTEKTFVAPLPEELHEVIKSLSE